MGQNSSRMHRPHGSKLCRLRVGFANKVGSLVGSSYRDIETPALLEVVTSIWYATVYGRDFGSKSRYPSHELGVKPLQSPYYLRQRQELCSDVLRLRQTFPASFLEVGQPPTRAALQ